MCPHCNPTLAIRITNKAQVAEKIKGEYSEYLQDNFQLSCADNHLHHGPLSTLSNVESVKKGQSLDASTPNRLCPDLNLNNHIDFPPLRQRMD